jgi:PTH1 family peptidyl-tRNA hydrolase
MKMIVGLGNPESRYAGTAHNLGFDVVNVLARRWRLAWRLQEAARAQVAEGRVTDVAVTLVKPMTFMNCSGEALGILLRQREWSGEDLLVVADDVALPVGRLRVRSDGRHGGHNGLRSVIERLGREDFARLRVGIDSGEPIDDLAEYVLRKLPPRERGRLEEMSQVAADAAEAWLREGATAVADRFNGLRLFQEPEADPPAG